MSQSDTNKDVYETNAKLCRAVELNPAIFDRNNPNYRKKLALEHCWESIAEECEDTVANCKRRWRQIRAEYVRSLTESAPLKRRKSTQKDKNFYLADVLNFLTPHLQEIDPEVNNEGDLLVGDETDSQSEVTTTTTTTTTPTPASASTPTGAAAQEAATIQKQTKNEKDTRRKRTRIEDKTDLNSLGKRQSNEKENTQKSGDQSKKETEQQQTKTQTDTSSDKKDSPGFFIKQPSKDSNRLIISKKTMGIIDSSDALQTNQTQDDNESNKTTDDPFIDEDLPLVSRVNRGRRSKRTNEKQQLTPSQESLHGVKDLPIQKPETRITRMTRRQSMSVVGLAMQNASSPLKMKPTPRPKQQLLPKQQQAQQQHQQQQQQVQQQQQQQQKHTIKAIPTDQLKTPIVRYQSLNNTALQANAPQPIQRSAFIKPPNMIARTSSQETMHKQQSDVQHIQDNYGSSSVSSSDSTQKPFALKLVSKNKQTNNQTTQCNTGNIFSDDDFLNIIRPQMAEMNGRQKLNFKRKVFQSLMEVFDDATDFPGAGEVQHFNINTPSGFEQVTDEELRLVRELVSLVSAAKLTPETSRSLQISNTVSGTNAGSAKANESLLKSKNVLHAGKEDMDLPRTVLHRLIKSAETNSDTTSVSTINGEKRCIYRIVPKTNTPNITSKSNATAASPSQRQSAAETSPNGRAGTFIIQNSSPNQSPSATGALATKTVTGNTSTGSVVQRIIAESGNKSNAQNASQVRLVSSGNRAPISQSQTISANTTRAMSRRYSVCGPISQNGPNVNGNETASAAVAAANKSLTNLANNVITSTGSNTTSTPNGVQVTMKRRLPTHITPFGGQRMRYPHGTGNSVVAKTAVLKASLASAAAGGNKMSNITNAAGNVYTEFFAPPGIASQRNLNHSAGQAQAMGLLQVQGTSVQSGQASPFKRIQTSLRPASKSVGNANSKNSETSLARLFNDNPESMETAAIFQADDFSTVSNVNIKQEQEDILGM